MAAASAVLSAVDLKVPSSYPVRLGSSILRYADSKTYSSVRYNHKPRTNGGTEPSSSIRTSKDGSVQLSLPAGSGAYGYKGKTVDDTDRYVLLSKGNGKDKELVLEKVTGSHDFNLASTPSESDESKLADRYQQLPADTEDDGLFGDDEDVDEPVDADNPFDFRNHLKAEGAKPRLNGSDTPQSAAATPRPTARATTSTPLAQPRKPVAPSSAAQKKRKPQDMPKPNPKRVKAGTEPPAPTSSSRPKVRDVPSVRIDRKASVRRPSFDDSGELILENETPVTEKPPRAAGAMALALSGHLGQGPISLRSAASSPASRNASPMPRRPEGIESPAEFDLGESSPEMSSKRPTQEDYFSNAGEDDEEDADADADVEDFELPSPRQRRKSTVHAGFGSSGAGGGGDEDFDMERELELALAQDDGAVTQATALNESDEESEEE